jgi:uncharacterized protein YcbX
MSGVSQDPVGSVAALWRYPVKSMLGEELNASHVTAHGLLGDRAHALVDSETGKVVSAKNPRKWPDLFHYRAAFFEPPCPAGGLPAVRITLPDGTTLTGDQPDISAMLSRALGREVTFQTATAGSSASASSYSSGEARVVEEYWPDIAELDYRDTITDFNLPEGTFFDSAVLHILTTATLDRFRELYPQGRFEARRFRPNIVIATPPEASGFVENNWAGCTLAIGDEVRLEIIRPCYRCVMTTLPQADLPRDLGILRTAAQHNGAHVGVLAAVRRAGTIRHGDIVRLE